MSDIANQIAPFGYTPYINGLAVQIALEDPAVPPQRTYELAMRFAAGQLGFDWKPARKRARKRGR